jgi:hypothetical protein
MLQGYDTELLGLDVASSEPMSTTPADARPSGDSNVWQQEDFERELVHTEDESTGDSLIVGPSHRGAATNATRL